MYALNLTDKSRISVLVPPTCEPFAPEEYLRIESVPEEVQAGPSDYRYEDGEFILDPLPVPPEPQPDPTGDELAEGLAEVAEMAATNSVAVDDIYAALAELAGMIGG